MSSKIFNGIACLTLCGRIVEISNKVGLNKAKKASGNTDVGGAENQPAAISTKTPKWKTSLTEDFGFKESSHGVRFASIVTRMISKPLDAIGHVLGRITKSGDNLIGQSRVAELRKINESPVINSQTEVNLEAICKQDADNGTSKLADLKFAAELMSRKNATGLIYPESSSIPKFVRPEKGESGKVEGKREEERIGVFSLDGEGDRMMPAEVKENVSKFVGQLDRGGFELCKDGFIRQKGNSNAFEAKLGYDKDTGKVFLSFMGSKWGDKRSSTWASDVFQQVGFTDNLYKQAVLISDMAKQCLGSEKLVISGHSLGGGMAQLAAAVNGLEAVVINPAPVNKTIWARTGLNNAQLEEANKKIYQLSVKNDPISDWAFSNSSGSLTAQIGQKIILDPSPHSKKGVSWENHSGRSVKNGMNMELKKLGEGHTHV
jgi:hypothetical protein